jgi:hypothetical protein
VYTWRTPASFESCQKKRRMQSPPGDLYGEFRWTQERDGYAKDRSAHQLLAIHMNTLAAGKICRANQLARCSHERINQHLTCGIYIMQCAISLVNL